MKRSSRSSAFVNTITRVACICRQASLGREKRYCYGVSLAPNGGRFAEILQGLDQSFLTGPDAKGLEVLTKEEALTAFQAHEQEGLCHSVWTFHTPFIGGICNCDRSDCMAMHCTVTQGVPVMFRGEYVAQVDPDLCLGCRECLGLCQFGAVTYSAANHKAVVDQTMVLWLRGLPGRLPAGGDPAYGTPHDSGRGQSLVNMTLVGVTALPD